MIRKNKIFKRLINILSVALVAGFLLGFASFFGQIKSSLSTISSHNYIRYKMLRSASLYLQPIMASWVIITLWITLSIFILWAIWTFALSRIIKALVRNPKKKKTYSVYFFCLLFLFLSGWVVNAYRLSYSINTIRVICNLGILLLTICLGWVLLKVRWYMKRRLFKYTRIGALLVILFLLIADAAMTFSIKHKPLGKANIIILLIDTLRKDHVGLYGYYRDTTPQIDRFAQTAATFQEAISQCSWTSPSVASLFSSLYPSVHGLITYWEEEEEVVADYLDNKIFTLSEVLRDKGYATGAFVANHFVMFERLGFYQGFDVFDPIDDSAKPLASKLNARALAWIREIKKRPFFAYLHYIDVHAPYEPVKEFDSFFKSDEIRKMTQREHKLIPAGRPGIDDLMYYIDKYDCQIRYVDHEIGKLLDELKNEGLTENSIIIITADHGEAFLEHGFADHGWSLYSEEIEIPLIIKFPESIKFQDITPHKIGLIDLAPTILSILDFKFPYEVNGRDLTNPSVLDVLKNHEVFSEELSKEMNGPPKIAMIKDGMKAIYMVAQKSVTELYNLQEDKLEKKNLLEVYPDQSHNFEKKIKAWRMEKLKQRMDLGFKNVSVLLEERKLLEQLKSLGYLK